MYRLILVQGLKRSGTNAIVNWLHRRRFSVPTNVVPLTPTRAGTVEVRLARHRGGGRLAGAGTDALPDLRAPTRRVAEAVDTTVSGAPA